MNATADQVQALELERRKLINDHQVLFHQFEEQRRINEALELEKRDTNMRHNEETSSLRRKIQVLERELDNQHDQHLTAPAMSAKPSSTGYTEVNADMNALHMGHEWDDLFLTGFENDSLDEFTFETGPEPSRPTAVVEKRPSAETVVAGPSKKPAETSSEPPIASGLLFFLLLCGAFVASRPANSRSTDLPYVPSDVRAVAPKVLDNLLAESSATTSQTNSAQNSEVAHPARASTSHGRSHGRLDEMHHRITSPTKQQEIDAAATLTPAQYASITNMDFTYGDQPNTSRPPRRNLAEALAGMHDERSSKAEVYTRSLLWEQIPPHVVQQFKEVIRDHEEIETRRQQQPRRSGSQEEMFGFKVEA